MRFFLIDKITRWEPTSMAADVGPSSSVPAMPACAQAVKNVSLSEDFFDDHFPRRPVMPGVLIVEGMAQLAGLLLEACWQARTGQNPKALLTVMERTKFRQTVSPGDTLVYDAQVMSVNESGGKARVQAQRSGELVAESALVFAFQYVQDPRLDQKRRELLDQWLGGA